MAIAFLLILLGLAVLIQPLRYNRFYLLNAAVVTGAAYWTETHYFRISPEHILSYKTFLIFLVFYITCINLTTIFAYGVDKLAARVNGWRVPEKDLHMLEFLGGWIGAFIAQHLFHHKTSKKSFQKMYHLMIVFEIAAVAFILFFFGLI